MKKTGCHWPPTSRWDFHGALKLLQNREPETSAAYLYGQYRYGSQLYSLPKGFIISTTVGKNPLEEME